MRARVCVCVCARACVRARATVCVCVYARHLSWQIGKKWQSLKLHHYTSLNHSWEKLIHASHYFCCGKSLRSASSLVSWPRYNFVQRHTLLRYFFGRNWISSLDEIVCRGMGESQTYTLCVSLWGGGGGGWTNLQQPPLGWNDPLPDEYSWADVKQISA